MSVQNGTVVSETSRYKVVARVFKRRRRIPLFRRKITYLVGYNIINGIQYFDDAVFISGKSSWLDPFQIFSKSGHIFLTRQALKKCGIFKNDHPECIAANLQTDSREHFYPHQHYLPSTREKSEDFLRMCLYMAVHSDHGLFWLGKGLHTLQDRFAHYEQNATLNDHMPFGKDPDNPAKHPYEYWQAYRHSVEYVRKFLAQRQVMSINVVAFVKDRLPDYSQVVGA